MSERPTVRLSTHRSRTPPAARALAADPAPTVRLAVNGPLQGAQARNGACPLVRRPDVRLAVVGTDRTREVFATGVPPEAGPALLVSYVYLPVVEPLLGTWAYRDWVMDSGAFSAHNSGTVINLQDYIDACKRLRDSGTRLTEVFALDVIGDWRASMRNTEEMWRQGVEAIPCYHWGEPEDVLLGMARDYPKIALGGVALRVEGKKLPWARRCFDRVWPKRVHGFAFSGERSVMALPWDSVDATNWELGPAAFGSWKTIGKGSWRGSRQNLRAEVQWYLDLERRARERWAQTWAGVEV